VVKLVSPDAPDLTVIDLPGIVRTATAGQANSVIDEVRWDDAPL
jgi:interferon-induced GTP-binding protein Mx1